MYRLISFTQLAGDENPSNDTNMISVPCIGEYYLIYGNRDGSPIQVAVGDSVEIPAWGATSGYNYQDTVCYIHMPLASNDSVISQQLGGYFPDVPFDYWDDV